MSEQKVYPSFYRGTDGYDYLYLDAVNYYDFANTEWSKADRIAILDHENDINVTNEYLANTYGEVDSPEHAEFIIELVKNADLKVYIDSPEINRAFFTFNENSMLFFYDSKEDVHKDRRKKITIPLPPKQTQTATPEEEFEMEQIMKNAGDNLILGCEDSKCDEWPYLGSKVQTSDGAGIVELLPDTKGYCVVSVDGEYYQYQIYELEKPKTPEEELRDDLIEYLNELGSSAHYCFGSNELAADELLKSYNITKKQQ